MTTEPCDVAGLANGIIQVHKIHYHKQRPGTVGKLLLSLLLTLLLTGCGSKSPDSSEPREQIAL